jgi:Na+-driven multidrug efflux pump
VILFNSLFTGVGQSVQPIIATNYGAGYMDRIQKLKKLSLFTIVILGMIFSLSGIMFPESVCKIFLTITPEMSDIAKRGIRLYFVAFLPMGINLLTSYLLQAVMKVKKALLISLLRNILLSSVCILNSP